MEDQKTSVIIITKNRPEKLRACLTSLIRQTKKPSEVVITDSSNTPLKHDIETFRKNLPILYYYQPFFSIPQARNNCIKHATYYTLLSIDDDCVAEKHWIEKMLILSQKNRSATIISGKLIHTPQESLYSAIIKTVREHRLSLAGEKKQIYFNIENCLIRKSWLSKHKIAFDETMLHEEFLDLALQVINKNGIIVITSKPVVYHYERATLFSFLKQRLKNSGNTVRIKTKWAKETLHFFGSKRGNYISSFFKLLNQTLNKKGIIEALRLISIVVLASVVYEIGKLYYTLTYHRVIKKAYYNLKTFIDPIIAILLFIVSIPLIGIIAVCIAVDSPGPILFSQIRVGKNGKRFRFYKFRTMWHNARKQYPKLYEYKYTDKELATLWFKMPNDPRLTSFGRYLRRTSLDELPNLINIIKGDMSLVGPRPEIPEMLPYYTRKQMTKFNIKPGITGYAQVNGRGLLTFQQTVIYDLQYMKEQNLITDITILVKTVYTVIKGFGAF